MKRIILCFAAILLLFAACKKNCLQKHPKDVKPIDWENYNDVYTVFWNCYGYCDDYIMNYHENIMVSGWISQPTHGNISAHHFILVNNQGDRSETFPNIPVKSYALSDELQAMFDTCDLTKKCFIKGKLQSDHIKMGLCCEKTAQIGITDITDIYFE